jgi:hypothetical protein
MVKTPVPVIDLHQLSGGAGQKKAGAHFLRWPAGRGNQEPFLGAAILRIVGQRSPHNEPSNPTAGSSSGGAATASFLITRASAITYRNL